MPAAVTVTDALPVPLVGETEAHAPVCKIEAVHAQETPLALNVSVWLPPFAINNKLEGAMVKEHALVPASDTGIDCPATVMFPFKFWALELGCAVARMVALPVPLVVFKLNQLRAEDAVQAQFEALAVIVIAWGEPPVAGNARESGETLYEQTTGPSCVILTADPAINAEPSCAAPVVLAPVVTTTVVVPEPLRGLTVIHGLFEAAVHWHPAPTFTVTFSALPPTGKSSVNGETA